MLLIFGLSVFFRTVGQGDFHCPGCGGDRHYRQRVARRWFTLFFIPVIPLNRVGEVVECTTCRTRYNLDVLRLPTAREMAAALPAAMRASAAAVLAIDSPSRPKPHTPTTRPARLGNGSTITSSGEFGKRQGGRVPGGHVVHRGPGFVVRGGDRRQFPSTRAELLDER